MATFKNPSRMVWHTSVCSRCNKVITRVQLPGLFKVTSHRICDACLSEGGAAQAAAAAPAGVGSGTPAPAAAPARRPRGGGGARGGGGGRRGGAAPAAE
ncbi:MAG: hypothetical protein FI703_03245 [SAR202 cluster bacterium]|nr:hypothetical protein [SAR202 cluster bacterium]